MSRYIDADELKRAIRTDIMGGLNYEWFIDNAPTIDAVAVVRCKDCKYRTDGKCYYTTRPRNDDDYCSFGEKVTE